MYELTVAGMCVEGATRVSEAVGVGRDGASDVASTSNVLKVSTNSAGKQNSRPPMHAAMMH